MTTYMTTLELAKKEPIAFSALPEAYQADNCLVFWVDEDGDVCCKPAPGQEQVLGNWQSFYSKTLGLWIGVKG